MNQRKQRKLGRRISSFLLALSMLFSLAMAGASASAAGTGVDTASLLTQVFTGKGTVSDPYQIASEEDLTALQQISNGGGTTMLQQMYNNGATLYFQLTQDITLTTAWTPIAASSERYFAGTFDGGGHTISGLDLAVQKSADDGTAAVYAGLFGYVKNGTIHDLTVQGTVRAEVTAAAPTAHSSEVYAGGVAAYAENTTLTNCQVSALTVTASNADNGVHAVKDDPTTDEDETILASDAQTIAGGVVGYMDGTAVNCSAQSGTSVRAEAKADGDRILTTAGGVIGLAEGAVVSGGSSAAQVAVKGSATAHEDSTSTNANYEANLVRYRAAAAGGFIGASVGAYEVETVPGSGGSGPQAQTRYTVNVEKIGQLTGLTSSATVKNETTLLDVTGGVAGFTAFSKVSQCEFSGSVTGTNYNGGIVGFGQGYNTLANCTLKSTAEIRNSSYAGGIAGQFGGLMEYPYSEQSLTGDPTVTGCTTESGAVVAGSDRVGGIIGNATYVTKIQDCVNSAQVMQTTTATSPYPAGGVVGYLAQAGTMVERCSNTGAVTSNAGAAGVAGYVADASTIKDCSNSGAVTSTYAEDRNIVYFSTGGVVGWMYSKGVVEGCVNSGIVTARNGSSVGGVVGIVDTGVSVRNSGNIGSVSVENSGTLQYAGGVVGYIYSPSATLLNSYNKGSVSNGAVSTGGVVGHNAGTVANCYSTGVVSSGAGSVGAVMGYAAAGSNTDDLFARTGTAAALVGTGGTAANSCFFNEDLTLTSPSTYGANLLDALNGYVRTKVDGVCVLWEKGEDGLPVPGSEIPTDQAAVPSVPTFQVNGEAAAEHTMENGGSVTITAITSANGYTVLYQWYKSVNQNGAGMEKIEGATSKDYTFSPTQAGICYLFVGAAGSNGYHQSEEVLGGPFTITVTAAEGDTAWHPGSVEPFQLRDPAQTNSASNPYLIDTPAKLAYLAQQVNGGTSYEGEYFLQIGELDLNSQPWTPIGTASAPFQGIYDGDHSAVTNLYVEDQYAENSASTPEVYGLFGAVAGGTVKGLTVSGEIKYSCVTAPAAAYNVYMGGIAGQLTGGGTIENCTVKDLTVTSTHSSSQVKWLPSSGGIVGYVNGATVSHCTAGDTVSVTGPVATTATAVLASGMGGVAGYAVSADLSDCTSAAAVSGQNAGGIAGRADSTEISGVTENTGAVTGGSAKYSCAGGLVGYMSAGTLQGGTNSGAVRSGTGSLTYIFTGGLVGYLYSSSTLSSGTNSGTVSCLTTGNYAYTGGLVGYLFTSSSLSSSTNSGAVTSSASGTTVYTGGLVGYQYTKCTLYNSSNSGTVTADGASGYTGGLVGCLYYNSVLYNSYNNSDVSGKASAGGLVGRLYGTTSATAELYNSYNTGAVSGATAGGLIGTAANYAGAKASCCYFLTQDGLAAIGSQGAKAVVTSIGSFDATQTVTAVDGSDLEYTGNLLKQLNCWSVSHQKDAAYPGVIGWKAQEDDYPALDGSLDLNILAAAEIQIQMDNMTLDLNAPGVLTAELSAADGVIGTVTYQWYKNGEQVAGADGTVTLDESNKATIRLDLDTSTPGSVTYRLETVNSTPYSNQKNDVSAVVKVNKAAGDTSWYGDPSSGFAGGSGTAGDPYLISDADQLAYLAQQVQAGTDYSGQYIKLTADLDLNSFPWTPIGTTAKLFSGTFDGGGHTISGLYINGTGNYQGLFGAVGNAAIKNVVVSGEVTGTSYAAGLVGCVYTGSLTLENCGNEASVTSNGAGTIGGLLGGSLIDSNGAKVTAISITGCYNAGAVTSNHTATSTTVGIGGLAGAIRYGTTGSLEITNSYNIGAVTSNANIRTGGILGYRYSSSNVPHLTNCYNAGVITVSSTNTAYSGALLGTLTSASEGVLTNCYYLTSAFGTEKTANTIPVNEAQLAALAGTLGGAWVNTTARKTVTFTGGNAVVRVNGAAAAMNTPVTAAGWPALSWQKDPVRETGAVTFTVTAADGYLLDSVKVNDAALTAGENGAYTAIVNDDAVTVVISVRKDPSLNIQEIIDSVAAGTNERVPDTSEEPGNGYDGSLDTNDDGKNDLLDILDILYQQEAEAAANADAASIEGEDLSDGGAENSGESADGEMDSVPAAESTE